MIEYNRGWFRVSEMDVMTLDCSRVDMSFKEMRNFPTYRLDGRHDLEIYVAPYR